MKLLTAAFMIDVFIVPVFKRIVSGFIRNGSFVPATLISQSHRLSPALVVAVVYGQGTALFMNIITLGYQSTTDRNCTSAQFYLETFFS